MKMGQPTSALGVFHCYNIPTWPPLVANKHLNYDNSPKSSNLTSLAAFSPSNRRFLSICFDRSAAALSSALVAHPILKWYNRSFRPQSVAALCTASPLKKYQRGNINTPSSLSRILYPEICPRV